MDKQGVCTRTTGFITDTELQVKKELQYFQVNFKFHRCKTWAVPSVSVYLIIHIETSEGCKIPGCRVETFSNCRHRLLQYLIIEY